MMTGYELSKSWFDWSFENPEKISPNHSAIFFFAIEHCNRLGWKEKFGFPTQMAMDAIGIKKHETYIRYFNDLCEWGFFNLIQKSSNQYSANIISLKSAIPKNGGAYGKAIRKHAGKQTSQHDVCHTENGESIGESNRSIYKQLNIELNNKPITNKTLENSDTVNAVFLKEEKAFTESIPAKKEKVESAEVWPTFEDLWTAYDKKVGDKPKLKKKFNSLPQTEKEKIMEYVPRYVEATPDKVYRKHLSTFLNQASWNDEIIKPKPYQNEQERKQQQSIAAFNFYQSTK